MVFSSIPAYLDPVNYWQPQQPQEQQHQQLQIIGTTTSSNSSSCNSPSTHHHQLLGTTVLLHGPGPHPPPPQTSTHPHVGSSSGTGGTTGGGGGGPTSTGSIRPGSMAERARMANIPMPEASLKCPRCESTNTKFCYFNNYSLSQPRHFCKTCKRYWTRGGALRNVPVGGGCRRNKRSKGGSSSKSGASCSSDRSSTTTTTTATATTNTTTATTSSSATSSAPSLSNTASLMADILGLNTPHHVPLRLMPPLTSLNLHHDYGGGLSYGAGAMSATAVSDMGFQLGSCFLSAPPGPNLHFPSSMLDGIDSSTTSLYPFHEGSIEMSSFGQVRPKLMQYPGMGMQQHAAADQVKMAEEINQELSLSRKILGLYGNDQYWDGGGSTLGSNGGAGGSGGGSGTNNMSGV